MAVHWQIPFKSLRSGTDYTVNIYDSSFSGTPVQLIGAANPFYVREDDNDDMFTPVRTQSGYIRIVDTGSVKWTDIIPTTATSRPVTLTTGNSVLWQGFMQPRTFSGELYGNPQEREFPICCPLSILDAFDVSPTFAETADFGQVLGYILEFIPSLTIGDIYIAGGYVDEWLTKKVDWSNFREEDDEGNEVSKYTAGQLLTEVCTFWGWTARTYQQSIYFTAADSSLYPAFMCYAIQDLTSGSRQPTSAYWGSVTLSGAIFASRHNSDEVMMGIHKATLSADIGKFDSVLELDFDRYEDWLDRNNIGISHTAYGSTGHFFARSSKYVNVVEVEQGRGVMSWDFGNCTLEIDVQTSTQPYDSAGRLYQYYNYDGDLVNLHDIPFTSLLRLLYNDAYANNNATHFTCCRIKSKHIMNLDHGVIVFCGSTTVAEVKNNAFNTYNGYCQLTCRLKIGDKYWDGSAWTTTNSTFTITNVGGIAWSTGQGKIQSNRTLDQTTWTSPYPNYEGFGIPITSSISGYITFEVLQVSNSGHFDVGQQWVGFSDFEIKFLRAIAYAPYSDKSHSEYIGSPINTFPNDRDVSTIFASDNGNAAGIGIILNTDNSYCQQVRIGEDGGEYYERPERFLVDRIAHYGAYTRRKLVLELNDNEISAISPQDKVTIDGDTFCPISITRRFRDDKTTLTLLEL